MIGRFLFFQNQNKISKLETRVISRGGKKPKTELIYRTEPNQTAFKLNQFKKIKNQTLF